jgi:hypothetical protein
MTGSSTVFLIVLLAMLCVTNAALADDRIAYAPDVVGVDRLFMVALKIAPDAAVVDVTVPEHVTLLDRTPPGRGDGLRKYYFRTVSRSPGTEVKFALPDGDVVVPLIIWSFDDLRAFRMHKNAQLPRRWPLGETLPELKQSQTLTTDQIKAAAEGADVGATAAWLDTSDELLWNFQPDSTIPRWHWVNIQAGCPIHGAEIYKVRSYYPWIKDTSLPLRWKIKCPIGGEEYPSNDIAAGDFTSGDYPDDGMGGGYLQDGKRYGFAAELAQHYGREFYGVAPKCADAYLATGDVRYVHKALVAMSRLAVEYAYLATMTPHRHRNRRSQVDRLGQGRFDEGVFLWSTGFTDYAIQQPNHQIALAAAYDKIFPAIEQDDEIIGFLQSKGFDIQTHEDVRRFIEENLFAVWMQGAMDGSTLSNAPYHQWGAARMALMLNYARGDEFVDWLYNKGGMMRIFVPNTFFRDGSPYESTGGYNGMHVVGLGPIVESIEAMRKLRPQLITEDRFPNFATSRRYRNIFDFSMDTVTIGRTYPGIGDGGGVPLYHVPPEISFQNGGVAAFEHAYRMFPSPKFAWALVNAPSWKPSADFPYTREQLEVEAADWPDDFRDRSALFDGYGLAILRSGEGDNRRALWLRYGRARSHVHDDMLDIGLDAHTAKLLQHMGYPRQWSAWEGNWMTHILAKQKPFVTMTATAQLFADAGPLHVGEALAHAMTDRVDAEDQYIVDADKWQRRTLAMIDVDAERFYCIDLHRVHGGSEHWRSFHVLPGEVDMQGVELTPQSGGTLAGEDVPYGDEQWQAANGGQKGGYGWRGDNYGFAHLYNVERATPDAPWHADWDIAESDGLHLRTTVPDSDGMSLALCDGKSPAGGSPYEMKWLVMHRTGDEPQRSQILQVIEPYRDEPSVRQAQRIELTGDDESGFSAYACRLSLPDDVTDCVLASGDHTVARRGGDAIRFAGRFGFIRMQGDQPRTLSLVGGTQLAIGDIAINMPQAEYRATITAVDRAMETITVSPAPPDAAALVGKMIYITNEHRRVACKVTAAAGDTLTFDYDSCIGVGKVTGVEGRRVTTDTPFTLHHLRYYHGARIVNHDGTTEHRIIEVRNKGYALSETDIDPDAFPTGSWFNVYDYGVGDEVVFPHVATLELVADGVYELNSTGNAQAQLPAGHELR